MQCLFYITCIAWASTDLSLNKKEVGCTFKILRISETYSYIERLSDVQLFYGNKM
jgi:hypothetical protein